MVRRRKKAHRKQHHGLITYYSVNTQQVAELIDGQNPFQFNRQGVAVATTEQLLTQQQPHSKYLRGVKVQREQHVAEFLDRQLALAGHVDLLERGGQPALPEPQLFQPARQALPELHHKLRLVYLLVDHLFQSGHNKCTDVKIATWWRAG